MGTAKQQERRIPLLPLRGLLVYPSMVLHLDVGRDKSVKALERAMVEVNLILLCSQAEIDIEFSLPLLQGIESFWIVVFIL